MTTPFKDLCKALELTESEHDEHADTIRRVLGSRGFDVNRLEAWNTNRKNQLCTWHVEIKYGLMLALSCCSVMRDVTSIYKLHMVTQH